MRLRHFFFLLALSALSVTLYVGLSSLGGSSGFPLDDAWIHQTYARNFAESGQFAYVPGRPSAGSTSPLWTLLIAVGYRLGIDYRLWTYALGAVSLALCAWGAERLSLRLWPDRGRLAWTAGLLCVFEWHLAWAAASGMETVLFAALALFLLERAAAPVTRGRDDFVFGALGGLLTATRPEGLLLAGLAGFVALFSESRHSESAALTAAPGPRPSFGRAALAMSAGFAWIVAPLAWLNMQASGTLFPNTFYAKQQEYAVYLANLAAWWPRALDVLAAPFVGAQVLLLPGFALEAFHSLRRLRDRATWPRALPVVWIAVQAAVYALRLPVVYQHARYLMPVIPIVIVFGLPGSLRLMARLRSPVRRGAAIGSLLALAAAFWVVGASAYRADVNIVEREMVASARWIAEHTPPAALIAAHDIGAIGYFARRPLLDLAGLISPEVIPIIRDEDALWNLLRARGADYLAAPPGFYARLPGAPEFEPVFAGDSPFAPEHWVVLRAEWQ